MSEPMHDLRFRKAEKLRHRTLVSELFRSGSNIYVWPLRLVWHRFSESEMNRLFSYGIPPHIAPLQLLITVPKKKLHHAVDRVLMRRRIREAYRINRVGFRDSITQRFEDDYTLSIGLIYMSDKIEDFKTVESSMKKILSKLESKL